MSVAKKKPRYKHSAGKHLIEVRVKSPLQLFDARDPAPFRDRDLDDDFVEYIMAAVREFPISSPLKILIHIDTPETKHMPRASIREAIHVYLAYRIELQKSNLKSYIKRAQIFGAIGLLFLGGCIGVAQSLKVPVPPGSIGILREGIIIFGWVSIWKPIELVLFDWYPLFEQLRFYKKLLNTDIEIRFAANSGTKVP